MAEFSPEELRRAAERVKEMQRRSKFPNESFKNRNMPPVPPFVNVPKHEMPAQKTVTQNRADKNYTGNSLLNFINLREMNADPDRTLIIGLIILLSGEKIDEVLIMALIYLLL